MIAQLEQLTFAIPGIRLALSEQGMSTSEIDEVIGRVLRVDSEISRVDARRAKDDPERLLTQVEVSDFLSVSKRTVRRLTDEGTLPVRKRIGRSPRYSRQDVDRLMRPGFPLREVLDSRDLPKRRSIAARSRSLAS